MTPSPVHPHRSIKRRWHLLWLLALGLLSSGGYVVAEAARKRLDGGLGAAPEAKGAMLLGAIVLTWALALAYGWRWGGMPLTGLRVASLVAAPFAVVFAIQVWGLWLPYERFQSELGETLARYVPPWAGVLLLMHIDILLTPASPA